MRSKHKFIFSIYLGQPFHFPNSEINHKHLGIKIIIIKYFNKMSRNMFSPGTNFLRNNYLRRLINNYNEQNMSDFTCACYKDTINKKENLGYNDSTRTDVARLSQILSNSLGGRTVFGNGGVPITISYLGGSDGQPGGSPAPIRNKF